MSTIITAVFGIFSIIGGTIGYIKAGSLASIIAGGTSGALLLLCAFGMKKKQKLAFVGALVISLLLGARFGNSYFQTMKVMPHLIMVILAALTALSTVRDLLTQKN
ncbi:TMEM14 family protein [Candidatus Uabimicrobium amorphum]|uniref:Transmembrane protein 14C n=1 Tax=Uabimicrobium amorphum TaxID=2596890 RepID=A0A5S9F269_UABAM|nr:TMEM14 family protein [Candidatus Uabimicrobium amorphum]BBM82803.1 hypothetical protein UABAM_01146 [Candidatus Uabimicrobium amorphum]